MFEAIKELFHTKKILADKLSELANTENQLTQKKEELAKTEHSISENDILLKKKEQYIANRDSEIQAIKEQAQKECQKIIADYQDQTEAATAAYSNAIELQKNLKTS